jgi:REP element-mobilizing transposase RayT
MARPLRLEFTDALYHITSRGDRQEDIYEDDDDRKAFLSVLEGVCETYNWVCHAYCLMSNHYHLLIETPDANLSRGMRQLNGVYTQTFNRAHGRAGHVFQGRYKAILVEKESYLLELSRYIVLNPVRAGMVTSPGDWPWSSYRATVGQVKGPGYLNVDWVLAAFAIRKSLAIERYKKFVAEGKGQPSPWTLLQNQIYLGSEQFVEKMQSLVDGDKQLGEIPSSQRRPRPKTLSEYASSSQDRNTAISESYQSGGYTLKEIGDHFGLHYSSVSGIIKNHKSKT